MTCVIDNSPLSLFGVWLACFVYVYAFSLVFFHLSLVDAYVIAGTFKRGVYLTVEGERDSALTDKGIMRICCFLGVLSFRFDYCDRLLGKIFGVNLLV